MPFGGGDSFSLLMISVALGVVCGCVADRFASRYVVGLELQDGNARGLVGKAPTAPERSVLGSCEPYSPFLRLGGFGGLSPRRIAAAIILAAYFASMVAAYGIGVRVIALWVFGTCLLCLSLVDLQAFRIPNGLLVGGLIAWALYSAWLFASGDGHALSSLSGALVGGIVVSGFALLASMAIDRFTHSESLGGGDIKLLLVVGLFLGPERGLFCLLVACIFGILFSLACTIREKAKMRGLVEGNKRGTASLQEAVAHGISGCQCVEEYAKHAASSDALVAFGDPWVAGLCGTDAPPTCDKAPRVFPFGPAISLATWLTLLSC